LTFDRLSFDRGVWGRRPAACAEPPSGPRAQGWATRAFRPSSHAQSPEKPTLDAPHLPFAESQAGPGGSGIINRWKGYKNIGNFVGFVADVDNA
jgi:hypothetical protein